MNLSSNTKHSDELKLVRNPAPNWLKNSTKFTFKNKLSRLYADKPNDIGSDLLGSKGPWAPDISIDNSWAGWERLKLPPLKSAANLYY